MFAFLLTPPMAFIIVLLSAWLLLSLSRFLACKANIAKGSEKSYACGEDNYDNMAQPDYSQFFLFAFFFTLAHVAVLMMATVPKLSVEVFVISIVYIIAVIVGLSILLRGRSNGNNK